MVLFKSGGTKCHHSIFGRGIRGMFPLALMNLPSGESIFGRGIRGMFP